jgi:hypothetical protein
MIEERDMTLEEYLAMNPDQRMWQVEATDHASLLDEAVERLAETEP